MLDRIRARPTAAALLFAFLLAAPTMALGYVTDDFMHALAIDAWRGIEDPARPEVFDTYVDPFGFSNPYHFFRGDPEVNERLVATGQIPVWWVSPRIQISFFRPLSSATLVFDHVVLAGNRPLAHLHSIGWYLAMVAAFAFLLGEHKRASLGALALVLFAIDETHFLPAGWLANRNALVAAVPAVFALAFHIRGRRVVSLLLFAVALLGGEAALGAFLYLFAYEAFGRRDAPLARRALALAPAVALGVAWAIFYRHHGYGASGSGLYIDPTGEPLAYLAAAAERIPILVGAALVGVPSDISMFAPYVIPGLIVLGIIGTAFATFMLRRAWPELEPGEQELLRWMIPGALLSLLPVVATFPLDRLLLLPTLGGSLVVATAMRHTYRRFRKERIGWLLIPIALVHTIAAPFAWLTQAGGYRMSSDKMTEIVATMELDRDRLESTRVLVIASDPLVSMYLGPIMHDEGWGKPKMWTVLSMAPHGHRIVRVDERTIDLEVINGAMLNATFDKLFRGERDKFAVGDEVRLEDGTARILRIDERGPTAVRFTTSFDFDDPDVALLMWRDGTMRRVDVPAPGKSLDLPWTPGPIGM